MAPSYLLQNRQFKDGSYALEEGFKVVNALESLQGNQQEGAISAFDPYFESLGMAAQKTGAAWL